MKERPILFSAPMVRAILAGCKSQTRRIVKPQPFAHERPVIEDGEVLVGDGKTWRLPYGKPGDRLWVRETFCAKSFFTPTEYRYRADGVEPFVMGPPVGDIPMAWKPSIFMPRAASRITLEVTGVRVERVNDISEADAVAEGIPAFPTSPSKIPRMHYATLWNSINGAGSWDLNPWVWRIEFKRLTQ